MRVYRMPQPDDIRIASAIPGRIRLRIEGRNGPSALTSLADRLQRLAPAREVQLVPDARSLIVLYESSQAPVNAMLRQIRQTAKSLPVTMSIAPANSDGNGSPGSSRTNGRRHND